jgi:hypothetical protein
MTIMQTGGTTMTKMTLKALNGHADAPTQSVTTEERQHMIAEAAYYRALQRGFDGGNPEDDWMRAEQEIDGALLNPPRQKQALLAYETPERHAVTTRSQTSRQRRHPPDR